MKVDERVNLILEKAYNITGTDYKVYWRNPDEFDGWVNDEDVMKLLEDIVYQYEVLEEIHEDYKNEVDEYYERKQVYEDPDDGYDLDRYVLKQEINRS